MSSLFNSSGIGVLAATVVVDSKTVWLGSTASRGWWGGGHSEQS